MKISNDTLAASGKLYDMAGADSLCKRPAWRKARCALHMKLEPEFTWEWLHALSHEIECANSL